MPITSLALDADTQYILSQIRCLNKKFRKACGQVILLNNKIDSMKSRYDRARRDNRRSFRYSQRIQLCAYEGVRNMFYEYACMRCDELEQLQSKFMQATGFAYDSVNIPADEESEEENILTLPVTSENDTSPSENNVTPDSPSENISPADEVDPTPDTVAPESEDNTIPPESPPEDSTSSPDDNATTPSPPKGNAPSTSHEDTTTPSPNIDCASTPEDTSTCLSGGEESSAL